MNLSPVAAVVASSIAVGGLGLALEIFTTSTLVVCGTFVICVILGFFLWDRHQQHLRREALRARAKPTQYVTAPRSTAQSKSTYKVSTLPLQNVNLHSVDRVGLNGGSNTIPIFNSDDFAVTKRLAFDSPAPLTTPRARQNVPTGSRSTVVNFAPRSTAGRSRRERQNVPNTPHPLAAVARSTPVMESSISGAALPVWLASKGPSEKRMNGTPLPPRWTNQLDAIAQTLIPALFQDKNSWPFRRPVNAAEQELPMYKQVVKVPMDLSTIQDKLAHRLYRSGAEAISDVQTIFDNCRLYNIAGKDAAVVIETLEAKVDTFLRALPAEKEIEPEGNGISNRNHDGDVMGMDVDVDDMGTAAAVKARGINKRKSRALKEDEDRNSTSPVGGSGPGTDDDDDPDANTANSVSKKQRVQPAERVNKRKGKALPDDAISTRKTMRSHADRPRSAGVSDADNDTQAGQHKRGGLEAELLAERRRTENLADELTRIQSSSSIEETIKETTMHHIGNLKDEILESVRAATSTTAKAAFSQFVETRSKVSPREEPSRASTINLPFATATDNAAKTSKGKGKKRIGDGFKLTPRSTPLRSVTELDRDHAIDKERRAAALMPIPAGLDSATSSKSLTTSSSSALVDAKTQASNRDKWSATGKGVSSAALNTGASESAPGVTAGEGLKFTGAPTTSAAAALPFSMGGAGFSIAGSTGAGAATASGGLTMGKDSKPPPLTTSASSAAKAESSAGLASASATSAGFLLTRGLAKPPALQLANSSGTTTTAPVLGSSGMKFPALGETATPTLAGDLGLTTGSTVTSIPSTTLATATSASGALAGSSAAPVAKASTAGMGVSPFGSSGALPALSGAGPTSVGAFGVTPTASPAKTLSTAGASFGKLSGLPGMPSASPSSAASSSAGLIPSLGSGAGSGRSNPAAAGGTGGGFSFGALGSTSAGTTGSALGTSAAPAGAGTGNSMLTSPPGAAVTSTTSALLVLGAGGGGSTLPAFGATASGGAGSPFGGAVKSSPATTTIGAGGSGSTFNFGGAAGTGEPAAGGLGLGTSTTSSAQSPFGAAPSGAQQPAGGTTGGGAFAFQTPGKSAASSVVPTLRANPFGGATATTASTAPVSTANPFGGAAGGASSTANLFGGAGTGASPFGAAGTGTGAGASPFGATGGASSTTNPFGSGGTGASPFGGAGTGAGASPFGGAGGAASSTVSAFGSAGAVPSPMGGGVGSGGAFAFGGAAAGGTGGGGIKMPGVTTAVSPFGSAGVPVSAFGGSTAAATSTPALGSMGATTTASSGFAGFGSTASSAAAITGTPGFSFGAAPGATGSSSFSGAATAGTPTFGGGNTVGTPSFGGGSTAGTPSFGGASAGGVPSFGSGGGGTSANGGFNFGAPASGGSTPGGGGGFGASGGLGGGFGGGLGGAPSFGGQDGGAAASMGLAPQRKPRKAGGRRR